MPYIKRFLPLVLMLTLISCNHDSENKTNQSNFNTLNISNNQDIFGTWSMCATYGNGTMVQFNTCPTIVFKNTGTGFIERNSIISENFSWSLKEPHLKILYVNKGSDCTFPDTNYYADFSKKIDGVDLILKHNDQSYYLSKGVIKQ